MDNLVVRQVKRENWEALLTTCFSSDNDLISKWHIESGTNVKTCVHRTLTDLLSCDLNVFTFMVDDQLAAYFGKERCDGKEFMTGFFIMPQYRNRFFITQFWLKVRGFFDEPFYSGIYTKNIPARKFLDREGEIVYTDEEVTLFQIK